MDTKIYIGDIWELEVEEGERRHREILGRSEEKRDIRRHQERKRIHWETFGVVEERTLRGHLGDKGDILETKGDIRRH